MKNELLNHTTILIVSFLTVFTLVQAAPEKSEFNSWSLCVGEICQDNKSVKPKQIIAYLSYQGTATDDGNITGKNTSDEFHLFMNNEVQTTVYVISKSNYELWSSKKIMPVELKPGLQTYKASIAVLKKLEDNDETVDFYEITKLNSLVETEDIE